MALSDAFDNLQSWSNSLSDRERRLLGAMAVVFAALLVVLPMYVGIASISDIEDENEEIVEVLQDIQRSELRLRREKAERKAIEALYNAKAPSLGGFLEERAEQYGITGLGVTDQPNLDLGEYSRRSVRVNLPVVELRPLIEMLADIENSPYPVSIETIQMTGGRMRTGYTVKLAVSAYDRDRPRATE